MGKSTAGRRLCSAMKSTDLKYDVENMHEICCSLCMSIAFQPVLCNVCQHLFCEECFKSFYDEVKSCPLGCKNTTCTRAPDHILQKVRLCVFVCVNKVNGCTQDVPYDEVAHHDLTCAYKHIQCSGFKLCKTVCMRMDLYEHESLCPYSEINQTIVKNENGDANGKAGIKCRNCMLCKNGSKCFDNLYDQVKENHYEFSEILKSLISQIKHQNDLINELRQRLEKVEDAKADLKIDLNKLNHNVNTQINLELLTQSQQLESAGWLGAQHYANIKKCLPDLKDFYEHQEWKMLSNLGKLQIYSKNSGEDGVIHILARSELNHNSNDIGNVISEGNIFIKEDSHIIESENVQKIGDNMNVFYSKFNRFLVSEKSDLVYLCQKIQNSNDCDDKSIVFPFISINHYKKKVEPEYERLELKLGGWVLKSLGTNKTLVNVFFNIKFPSSQIPEELNGRHLKSISSMIRTLDSVCRRNYQSQNIVSKIFERSADLKKLQDADDEEEKETIDESKEIDFDTPSDSKESSTRIEYPTDIPNIPIDKIADHKYKDQILGTRSKLKELVDLINQGPWKFLKSKNDTKMFVKKSERGYICVKGEMYFPHDPERIIDYLRKVDVRSEYDRFTDYAQIIEELPYRTFLAYAKIKQILVVASRDIVFTSQIITSKKTKTVYTPTYSFEHPDYPAKKEPIRANVLIGGWVMVKKDEGCQVVYAVEIDPQGSLPKFLIEKTADIQIMIVSGLKKYMDKTEKNNPELVPRYPKESEGEEQEEVKTPHTPIHQKVPEPLLKIQAKEELKTSKSAQPEDKKLEEEKRPAKGGKEVKDKRGDSCEELKIDTFFTKFTENDIEDKINLESMSEESKHRVLQARKSTFDLINEVYGPYKQLKSQKKIDIFTRDNGKEGQSVLGIGEIPFSIEKICEVLLDEKQRKNFDDMMEDGFILKRLENLTFLIYVTFKRFLILSPRDFVLCGCLVKFNDGTIILPSYSVELPEKPEDKKFVRAHLHIGGWILKKIDDNNTLVYYYNRADMKGSIPDFVIKQGAAMQALLIAKLRDYMIKKDKEASK